MAWGIALLIPPYAVPIGVMYGVARGLATLYNWRVAEPSALAARTTWLERTQTLATGWDRALSVATVAGAGIAQFV